MQYQFEFRPYQRKFKRSLQTNHGSWDIRRGIIVRLDDQMNHVGFGEIAPLSWFGSETFEQALDFCQELPRSISQQHIFGIPDQLPACQFGFESAWENCHFPGTNSRFNDLKFQSGLLPAGETALAILPEFYSQGYRTFKYKISIADFATEIKLFTRLLNLLKSLQNQGNESLSLRLDANGGLNWETANQWLTACDRTEGIVEFLEQPLPVESFDEMLTLSQNYLTPIALDESVATVPQMQVCYQQGWRGIFVIKPCIAGSPSQFREFCRQYDIDAVFSSVFETPIGRNACFNLVAELQEIAASKKARNRRSDRALGFGVGGWFEDNDSTWLQQLWNPF